MGCTQTNPELIGEFTLRYLRARLDQPIGAESSVFTKSARAIG